MTLPVPELDDRTFLNLVAAARERIARTCPGWTDLSVHDPGIALVEVFAYLTETMLYRLNRLPEKAYVTFLTMLGVSRHPPSAAWVDLTFTRAVGASAAGAGAAAGSVAISIPAGTKVAAARGADPEPVVFVTTETAVLAADAAELVVRAHHCTPVEAELLGTGTGQPGVRLRSAHAPIAATSEPLDVLLGVEVGRGELAEGAAAREYAGRTFEIWQPVQSFAGLPPDAKVYLLDRASGTVTFAPALDIRPPDGEDGAGAGGPAAALAATPPSGREIRLWYRTGGGPAGNVAAGTLETLREPPVAGVKVTNLAPARGGRALEPIESVLARGPHEFFSLRRAVTARDFELLATASSGSIARARALTRAATWSFAQPGEVEVVLVPYVTDEARPGWRLPIRTLLDHQIDEALLRTQRDLDSRRALGTSCLATWARYKAVSIAARVVVRAEEDPDAVRARIHDRLHQTISPLPTPQSPEGWRFGEPLRASNVYRMLEQAEPGVRFVEDVRFVVEEAPDQRVRAVAADESQPHTWYAGCGEVLFRSTNGGDGWEPAGRFAEEEVRRVVPAPAAVRPGMTARPGTLAVATRRTDGSGSGVYVSADLGESWRKVAELAPGVTDLAWVDRGGVSALLLATDVGLYELPLLPDAVPLQVLVDETDSDRGFYGVASFVSERGVLGVALIAQAQYGVYLSTNGGRPGTFVQAGLQGMETRTLAIQLDGPATVAWVGTGEPDPNRPGQGCFRARLFETDVRWQPMATGWGGGTCWDLAFTGRSVLAGTQSGGVLRLDPTAPQPSWQPPTVNCGLPLRDRPRFESVEALAAAGPDGPVLAGTARGVFRSIDAARWSAAANRETRDVVTIPDTWLLCSGEHQIEVVRQHATPGD